jgi:hypothetical protein
LGTHKHLGQRNYTKFAIFFIANVAINTPAIGVFISPQEACIINVLTAPQ